MFSHNEMQAYQNLKITSKILQMITNKWQLKCYNKLNKMQRTSLIFLMLERYLVVIKCSIFQVNL